MDLMKIITVSKMKQKITEYLIENGKKYTQWYSGTLDNLVYDATEFFSTGNYNHDICDLMLKICSDTLDVNICVYQKSVNGQIKVINHTTPAAADNIKLKFTYNASNNEENHYDSITIKANTKINRVTSSDIFEEIIDLTCNETDAGCEYEPIDLTTTDKRPRLDEEEMKKEKSIQQYLRKM